MANLDYLSDIEKAEVIKFNSNLVLKNVIRKVLLETIYNNGTLRKDTAPDPTRNAALALAIMAVNGQADVSNEKLGEDLRGIAQGISFVEQGLAQLEKIKNIDKGEPIEEGNPAI